MAHPDGLLVEPKAPGDKVEYTITYKGLGTDTINSLGTSASGVTVTTPSPSYSGNVVTIWVNAGTVDTYGTVTVTIGTVAGRTFVRVIVIPIRTLP